ncbi:hypothetical protein [Neisseria sp. CCUG12390]|uniref:hypothetical protein n=1 Tax=Neisseria sp. CCUG12390 TaxID=3392035 RepID=UPI003A0FF209
MNLGLVFLIMGAVFIILGMVLNNNIHYLIGMPWIIIGLFVFIKYKDKKDDEWHDNDGQSS